MKNAQNEFGKSAEKSLSAATTTTITTTTSAASEQQSAAPLPALAAGTLAATPIRFPPENAENVHNNNATAANAAKSNASTTTSHAAKMTDEHNHENNNGSSTSVNNNNNNSNNNNSGNSIIAEAAKILLKNGLNGTSAAAAALLAVQSFQLPTFPLVSIPKSSPEPSLRGTTESLLEPPPAHVASTSKMSATTVSTAIALCHSPQRNNGLPSPSPFKANAKETYSAPTAVAAAASSSGVNFVRKALATSDAGVIDCSLGNTANGTQKATLGIASGTGGYSHAGGRLQFFKDGKFILELARSKDGERGGWVSVPRKQFRTPSATSSTVTPASTASACIYPKIESSTSFSFSDDNSSIQSSPWQRDHCWKQATPKRNISKEMSVFYQLPNGVKLTNEGLRLAKLKRRRPFDNTKQDIKHVQMFERSSDQWENSDVQEMPNGKSTKFVAAVATDEEEDRGSTSSVATLIGDNDNNRTEKMENNDRTTPTNSVPSPVGSSMDGSKENTERRTAATEAVAAITAQKVDKTESDIKMDETTCSSEVEKMNTSEDGELSTESKCKTSAKMATTDTVTQPQSEQQQQQPSTPTPVKSKTGVEDKRLIKKKIERAKLTTIVQKLIDQMPTRVTNLMKTPSTLNNSAGTQHQPNSNFLSNKVSPTTSSSTSPSLNSSLTSSACSAAVGTASHRLVEYHQQHVSPRKRILREFEKVSLDDNASTATGAGGKRSRAKSSANAAMSANYRNARSPNNRVHSSVCNVPTVASLSSSTTPSTTNGESVSKSNKNAATAATAPTRLYSSYSIHSLLGDNSSSKKTVDHSTAAFQQPQSELLFHMRKSVSPKSPDTGGGKSPSNVAHKKRSPPYASPLREAHSRSPTVVGNNAECSPRATPPTFKQRYDAPGLMEHQHNPSGAHHLHQPHHLSRQLPQQGAFYSPYMMSSSKYVPGASGAPLSAAGAVSPPSTSRSPRHSINAFTSCTTTPTTASATTTPTHYIPNAHRSMSQHREVSPPPPRSLADSPRDSTPRTVPKKTASIRRRFASPTSSSSSHSHNTTSSSSNSCPSPGERPIVVSGEDSSLMDSKSASAAAAAAAAAAYQQLFQRQSTSAAAAASPLHPAAYYMYPPAAPLQFSSNGASNSGASSSAHSSTSPYIPGLMPPSYYHSYISALNITKHYYMGAGASPQSAAAAAAARLSPPFHHLGIPYNGMAMAAAAAAAFTGQPPAHLAHHSMLPPAASNAAVMYGVNSLSGLGGLSSSSAPTAASSTITTSQKTNEGNLGAFNEALLLSNNSSGGAISAAATSMRSAVTAQHSHNIKNEQSSDVPLNLSKH